ncbi:tRNA pseudouridine(55) synthase TruB [Brassicibacter mesophilus]|uniref:tRNA pseudouridine(55) synthase TruB n=1 Tax=Brassicibacter mesophilus TaxID=745119 RepID=UPI003D23CCB6
MNGIINVLKPSGMTSHDVVSFIRRTLNIKKVGHTGTLDPNAAGVLPVCIGKATKLVQFFNDFKKQYRAELSFGYETDTQDKYGNVVNRCDTFNINNSDIERALNNFEGTIEQIPPMYSAIKYNGKKLYELAREGKTVERKPRKVIIYNSNLIKNYDNNKILFDVECSGGTYIRTLCNDIGRYLGVYGCMTFLLRTKVGVFSINDAFTLEEIAKYKKLNQVDKIILPLDYALNKYKSIQLNERYLSILTNGGKITLGNDYSIYHNIPSDDIIKVYCDNLFIGLGRIIIMNNEYLLKMDKVLV